MRARRSRSPSRRRKRDQHYAAFDRATLPPGFQLDGPAIVEEFGSTTVVFPGQTLDVDPHGILVIRSASRQAA